MNYNKYLAGTKKLFVNPFKFYVYVEVEDRSWNIYYTYDFQFFYVLHYCSDGKVYNDEKIYKPIFGYFDGDVMGYIDLMVCNYHHFFDIFILTKEIIPLKDIRDIIYHDMSLNDYFKIKCDA